MRSDDPGHVLRGRDTECDVLDRLLKDVRAGQSQVLVVRGEPGVGKSALLEYVVQSASGCRVSRAAGVEYEMELVYAGLQQLCAPMLDLRERLPEPQRDALETAFGLSAKPPPDRFVVGLAVLGLLSEAAEAQPLICLVDDAQWLDKASALTIAFVARRLVAESVGLVFAVRQPSEARELDGLPELLLGGLRESDARALLESAWPGRLDGAVLNRVVAEARGNSLALLELPRTLTPEQLAGGFGLPDVTPLANRIEQSFLRRLESLPDDTRRLLLTAAAEPVGDTTLLWRAADGLGLGADAAGPAQTAGLIDLGAFVRFRHPLVRSAVYQAAPVPDRRKVHLALARRPISRPIPIDAPGIARTRLRVSTSPWRMSWNAWPGARRPAAASPQRRVPRASSRADPGFGPTRSPGARRGASEVRVRCTGGRSGALGGCGEVPAGRTSARGARPPARRDRVRAPAR
jgi:hypothetical protein